MTIQIKYRSEDKDSEDVNLFFVKITPSVWKGSHGFYIYPLGKEHPNLFQKAGLYTFLFSVKGLRTITFEKKVKVRALSEVGSWRLLTNKQIAKFTARVGSCFPPFSIACFDKYNNRIQFPFDTKMTVKLSFCKGFTAHVCNMKEHMSSDNFTATIKDVQVESQELDKIRPRYNVSLSIISQDELFSISIPCQVTPGAPFRVLIHPCNFGKQLLPRQIINDLVLEVFDAYGNHVKENDIIHLQVHGFSVQEIRGLAFKPNDGGFVDLGGLLKVVEGYGKSVSFYVMSNNQMIFKQEFQVAKRELRAAFEVPILCAAGTQLEDLVFEVINTHGEVDESIHGEVENGQPHTLRIISDSFDNSSEYRFKFGRCTIQAIPVPQKEGNFWFKATHSHHPELHLNVEVHIVQHLNTENENVSSPCSDGKILLCQESSELEANCNNSHQSAGDPDSSKPSDVRNIIEYKTNHFDNLHQQECRVQHLGRRQENILTQSSECKILHSQEWSGLEAQGNKPHQSAERSIFLLPGSSLPSVVGKLIKCEMKEHEELEYELCQYGLCIKQHETNLEYLNLKLSNIEQDMFKLQASLDVDDNLDSVSGKDLVMEQIICKGSSAAAVICRFFQSLTYRDKEIDFANKILGVVAFLGTVRTHYLSRIFSQYLGEHQMLAIVCKSYEDAAKLEKYELDGRVNNAYGLHKLAAELGIFINKQYHVICLEDIRPYTGDCSCDPQKYLLLPNPTLPNGKSPQGFLGYAVNMIELDVNLLHWTTASGHGLREKLFYRLFGELQVYENRQYMNMASTCIKDSAVSLDGGIVRGNGVISLGYWEAEIQFPVVSPRSLTYFSQRSAEVAKEMEAKKQELKETSDQLKEEERAYTEVLKKFRTTKQRYGSLLDEKVTSLGILPCKIGDS